MGDLLDGPVEGLFIALGRRPIATDLAHELERGGADLLVCCYLVMVTKANDAAAHAVKITGPSFDVCRDLGQLLVESDQHQLVALLQTLIAVRVDGHLAAVTQRERRHLQPRLQIQLT